MACVLNTMKLLFSTGPDDCFCIGFTTSLFHISKPPTSSPVLTLQVIVSSVSSDHLLKVMSDLFCLTFMCHPIAAVTWLTPPGSVRKLLTMGFSASSLRFIFCPLFHFILSLQLFCFFSQLCLILFLSCLSLYFFFLLRSLSSFSLCVSLSLSHWLFHFLMPRFVLHFVSSLMPVSIFSSVLPPILDNIVGFARLF